MNLVCWIKLLLHVSYKQNDFLTTLFDYLAYKQTTIRIWPDKYTLHVCPNTWKYLCVKKKYKTAADKPLWAYLANQSILLYYTIHCKWLYHQAQYEITWKGGCLNIWLTIIVFTLLDVLYRDWCKLIDWLWSIYLILPLSWVICSFYMYVNYSIRTKVIFLNLEIFRRSINYSISIISSYFWKFGTIQLALF